MSDTKQVPKPDEIICDFFDKHNADEKQWDALDRLRELEQENAELQAEVERLKLKIFEDFLDKAINQPTQ